MILKIRKAVSVIDYQTKEEIYTQLKMNGRSDTEGFLSKINTARYLFPVPQLTL